MISYLEEIGRHKHYLLYYICDYPSFFYNIFYVRNIFQENEFLRFILHALYAEDGTTIFFQLLLVFFLCL